MNNEILAGLVWGWGLATIFFTLLQKYETKKWLEVCDRHWYFIERYARIHNPEVFEEDKKDEIS